MATEKKTKAPDLQEQLILTGITTGLQITSFQLASRDRNNTGIDDYVARKLAELITDIQQYQLTGRLPE
jgi:hypothetical protein